MELQPKKENMIRQYPTFKEYQLNRRSYLKSILKVGAVLAASETGLIACSQKKGSSDTCSKQDENITPQRKPGVMKKPAEIKQRTRGEPQAVVKQENDSQNSTNVTDTSSSFAQDRINIKGRVRAVNNAPHCNVPGKKAPINKPKN